LSGFGGSGGRLVVVSAVTLVLIGAGIFYFAAYLPYINGQNTPATETFNPVLDAIPNAETEHTAAMQEDHNGTIEEENRDISRPDISVPDGIIERAPSPEGAIVSFEVSAEDNVEGPVDVICDYNSGETFPIGKTIVTCTAEDSAGNREEESFTITVEDTD
jgi:hypothetical protein